MAIEEIGRITGFADTQANVEANSGALVEIRFGKDTDTGKLGFTIDAGATWTWITGAGAVAFTDLTDTFAAYTGLGDEYVKVKADESGLETGTPAGGGVARSGSTTDEHLAVWNGSDADSIKDGGAVPTGSGTLNVTTKNLITRTPLYDVTLTGTAASFDVSNIDQGYDDLEITFYGRTDKAAQAWDNVMVWFNNDTTTTNYHRAYQTGGQSHAGGYTASALTLSMPGATALANSMGIAKIWIPKYAGAKLKMTLCDSVTEDGSGTMDLQQFGTNWQNTAAINRITFISSGSANLIAGSRLQIIGIKTEAVVTDVTLT